MRVDIGNALSSVAAPGISRASLDRLDDRVADAHERIERGRADDDFGYAALDLPGTTDTDAIYRAVDELAFEDVPESVLLAGIGGSALGAATLVDALDADAELHVLDNVDPADTRAVLDAVDFESTALVVVSRSGTTTETLANFLVCTDAFERARVDWTERTLAITGEEGPLREIADQNGLATLPVPDGVPGRFSVCSAVGLAPAALAGVDVEGVLDGAGRVADDLSGSLYDCPPYAYGAVSYGLSTRGAAVTAMLPYAESLETYAEWFAQLWAESLGKDGLGQVPQRALGATDQHSQLQLYRAGPRNTMVSMVRPRERPTVAIPPTSAEDLAYLGGTEMAAVLDAEFEATEASLAAAGRPSVRVEIPAVDPGGVGELLYGMGAACVLAGELYGIETFDQPAVEWGKRATRGLLGGGDDEAAAVVEEKTTLVVD